MRCKSVVFVDIDIWLYGKIRTNWVQSNPLSNFEFGRRTPLKYPLPKQNMKENIFGGHFPSQHNGVTNFKL